MQQMYDGKWNSTVYSISACNQCNDLARSTRCPTNSNKPNIWQKSWSALMEELHRKQEKTQTIVKKTVKGVFLFSFYQDYRQ